MAAPRKYPIELKERALRLWRSEQPRRPIAHIARELGLNPETLRTWIRQDEADRGERSDRPTTAEVEELRDLRKRVRELTWECQAGGLVRAQRGHPGAARVAACVCGGGDRGCGGGCRAPAGRAHRAVRVRLWCQWRAAAVQHQRALPGCRGSA